MELSSEQYQTLADVVSGRPEVDVLYLYGSYATSAANRLSDVDLAILVSDEVPETRYFDLRRELIAVFASRLENENIDLIVLNNAPAHLAFETIAPRRILYEREPDRRVEFETRAVNRFMDFRPFLEVRRAYLKRQLAEGTFFG